MMLTKKRLAEIGVIIPDTQIEWVTVYKITRCPINKIDRTKYPFERYVEFEDKIYINWHKAYKQSLKYSKADPAYSFGVKMCQVDKRTLSKKQLDELKNGN